ncbi:MAG: hypothetical protein RIR26_31 [Pseudomonadota bacterium]|jgi:hypothetical protein
MRKPKRCRKFLSWLRIIIAFHAGPVLAQTFEKQTSEGRKHSPAVSLFEFNPADLAWGRYRVSYENLFMESASIAWTGEWQDAVNIDDLVERSLASGVALQVYPHSVALDGFFIRGEADVALAFVERKGTQQKSPAEATTAALRFAGDLGWRVRMSESLTGSAAYGLRSTVPQLLWGGRNTLTQNWIEKRSRNLDPRVQINLGVLL